MAYAPLPKKLIIDPAAVRVTGEELGRGAYGVVIELEVYGTRCAGKRLHEAFFSAGLTSDKRKVLDDFAKEIIKMRKLRHPNIVQYMGIYCEEASVTLVMEYLPSTLAQCLEADKYRHPNPGIPSYVKISLLIDIAQGLLFLHCRRIIHRDLSSNNVLVTHSWQAKISDLGVAKVMKNLGVVSSPQNDPAASCNRHDQLQSLNPGSILFMSPESRLEIKYGKAAYGPKLDCFSFGNLVILVALQHGWLDDKCLSDMDTNDGQTEVARRAYYLNQMEDDPLCGLARKCLLDDPELRPSAEEIVHQLKKISRDDPPPFTDMVDLYLEYVKAKRLESSEIADLEKNAAVLKRQNEELHTELFKQRTLMEKLKKENEAMKLKVKQLSEAKQSSKEDDCSFVDSHSLRPGEGHTEADVSALINGCTEPDVSTNGGGDMQDRSLSVDQNGHVTTSEKRLSFVRMCSIHGRGAFAVVSYATA